MEQQTAPLIKTVDLRRISRSPQKCLTTVDLLLNFETRIQWLKFGAADIHERGNSQKFWVLSAYMGFGATDFEHDSAHILSLPLIGLQLDMMIGHTSLFGAWIHPDAAMDFQIPLDSKYNPISLPDTYICKDKRCGEKHPVVPEGFYYPPHDPKLYSLVKGKRVEIHIGPVWPKVK